MFKLPIGRRLTKQRQVVLDALGNGKEHLTAEQVFQRCREKMPHISLGTVYRNLEFLLKQRYLHQVDYPGHAAHYDSRPETHGHFLCERCGQVADVELADLIGQLKVKFGQIKVHVVNMMCLNFSGICMSCLNGMTTTDDQ